MSIPFLAPSRWGIKLIKALFLETTTAQSRRCSHRPSGAIIFTIPAELHLQPCAGYFIEAPPPGPLVGSDPRSERRIVQWRWLQTDRRLPHQCNSPESTATGRRHRGNRRGSHPSYCDTPEVQTRARTTDGKDELRGNVSSHRCHAVQLTLFANGIAERWVGSCRRELLDHVIALNERHLRRLLSGYVSYYHDDRTHLWLRKETPSRRARSTATNRVISHARLGGLHHRSDYAA
jgi:hypothetical protein